MQFRQRPDALLGAGNSGVDGKPRTRVPKVPSHTEMKQPVVASIYLSWRGATFRSRRADQPYALISVFKFASRIALSDLGAITCD